MNLKHISRMYFAVKFIKATAMCETKTRDAAKIVGQGGPTGEERAPTTMGQ